LLQKKHTSLKKDTLKDPYRHAGATLPTAINRTVVG
jgi:hypothetical protein